MGRRSTTRESLAASRQARPPLSGRGAPPPFSGRGFQPRPAFRCREGRGWKPLPLFCAPWAVVGAVLLACTLAVAQETVDTGSLRLTPVAGGVEVRFDPTGQGRYVGLSAALRPYRPRGGPQVETAGDGVRLTAAAYWLPGVGTGGFTGPFDVGDELRTQSLGQTFTVPEGGGWLCDVWALLTCSGVDNSAVTLILRRDGPQGEAVATRRVDPLPNDTEVHLPLAAPEPPGVYYLEVGERVGGTYWWGNKTDVYSGGEAYLDGAPLPGHDRRLGYALADVGVVDWEVRAQGATLHISGTVREQAVPGSAPCLALELPWEQAGYDTTRPEVTPFRWVATDGGYFLPVQAFKRLERDWSLEPACQWARVAGTGGYDLKLTPATTYLKPRMSADRICFLLAPGARAEALPPSAEPPAELPRFITSDPALNGPLNEFLHAYLTSHGSCPSGYEWDALKLCWVPGPIHDSLQRVIEHYTYRQDPDGYIWSRGESRGWDGGDASAFDSRHYDSNPPYILACWRWYCWTGDRGFLERVLPTVTRATDYLLDAMHGREGLLTIDSPKHNGVCGEGHTPWPSSYWDCIPAGYRDAYINAFYAPALHAAAELERAGGDAARADGLEALVARAREAFNATFWDDARGRYVGWVDADGGRHDCGMTYVNTMAATYGLASGDQVRRMFRWMTDEPTASGQPDTFTRWLFAPRSNTEHCSEQYNRLKYDEWCEDGGAILWTAFYELMARCEYLGPEDAWTRLEQVLGRFSEGDHLVGGNPLLHGEINNHGGPPGSVGVWGEFPESGVAPCAFLYAFVGVSADVAGLHIRPAVPQGLDWVGVEGLSYHGHRLRVEAHRGLVVLAEGGRTLALAVPPSGEVAVTEEMLDAMPTLPAGGGEE
jgi:hypothetical protein